jgi:hypothetical protein
MDTAAGAPPPPPSSISQAGGTHETIGDLSKYLVNTKSQYSSQNPISNTRKPLEEEDLNERVAPIKYSKPF